MGAISGSLWVRLNHLRLRTKTGKRARRRLSIYGDDAGDGAGHRWESGQGLRVLDEGLAVHRALGHSRRRRGYPRRELVGQLGLGS